MTGELADIAVSLRATAQDIRVLAASLEVAFSQIEARGVELRDSDLDYVRNRLGQLARQSDERAAVLDKPVTGHAFLTIEPPSLG